ncbi:MAG: DUF1460 domain-containing protein [Paramuribaculum sp.]|nr:DUF1460 domain-containing protein [Paramuribaculum sp.]
MTILRHFALFIIILTAIASSKAVMPGQTRFNNEATDTAAITLILDSVAAKGAMPANERISQFGRLLVGTPYVEGSMEATPEMLTVNMEGLDCTTFVETVMALTMTLESERNSWMDFLYNLEKIRYRGGRVNGYGSRLHYISDWIVDNAHRGNIEDVTAAVGFPTYTVKTLDFMSSNRSSYPALADDETYQIIKNMEVGYRSHRYPEIKQQDLKKARLREGDIVAITTNVKGLDVQHMGIIVMDGDTPHLLHASSKAGKVIIDPLPLSEYLRKNRSASGIRIIRLKD